MTYWQQPENVAFVPGAGGVPPTPFIHPIPLPSTPSSPFSQSTLPSVWTPQWTPPSSLYQLTPSPPKFCSAVNPSLLAQLDHDLARMSFDITRNPHPTSGLVTEGLFNPATHPPTRSLRLEGCELYWDISVRPNHCPFVTVFDILQAVHSCFRTRLLLTEVNNLSADEVFASFHQRVQSIGSDAERVCEWNKGRRRIDALCGKKIARFGPLFEDQKGLVLGIEFSYA